MQIEHINIDMFRRNQFYSQRTLLHSEQPKKILFYIHGGMWQFLAFAASFITGFRHFSFFFIENRSPYSWATCFLKRVLLLLLLSTSWHQKVLWIVNERRPPFISLTPSHHDGHCRPSRSSACVYAQQISRCKSVSDWSQCRWPSSCMFLHPEPALFWGSWRG